jgi:hypothetical protein
MYMHRTPLNRVKRSGQYSDTSSCGGTKGRKSWWIPLGIGLGSLLFTLILVIIFDCGCVPNGCVEGMAIALYVLGLVCVLLAFPVTFGLWDTQPLVYCGGQGTCIYSDVCQLRSWEYGDTRKALKGLNCKKKDIDQDGICACDDRLYYGAQCNQSVADLSDSSFTKLVEIWNNQSVFISNVDAGECSRTLSSILMA